MALSRGVVGGLACLGLPGLSGEAVGSVAVGVSINNLIARQSAESGPENVQSSSLVRIEMRWGKKAGLHKKAHCSHY